jgi:uncharacterized coiled-coil protein SlyX
MLLNEFLKEHRKVAGLEGKAAQQQQEIQALTAALKAQAAQIEKVNDQLAAHKPPALVVANN